MKQMESVKTRVQPWYEESVGINHRVSPEVWNKGSHIFHEVRDATDLVVVLSALHDLVDFPVE